MKKGSTICPLPWIHLAVKNNGEFRLCCHANVSPSRGVLRRDDGTVYRAGDSDLEKVHNAPLLQETRSAMLKGEWSPHCTRCQREEKAQMKSRRIIEHKLWPHLDWQKIYQNTAPSGELLAKDFSPLSFDIRFGNLCNLKCRSCGPSDSSAWYKDHYKLGGGPLPIDKDQHWYEDNSFWQYMSKRKDSAKSFYFVGGEPLLIPEHYQFLQKLVEEKISGEVIIEYNTNLTKLPSKALDLWPHFKQVKIGVSVDGHEGINDYIRFPSRWEEIMGNINKLDTSGNWATVWFTVTIMAYNIFYLPEIIDYFINAKLKKFNCFERNLIITPHPLHHPTKLNIKVFPRPIKEKIRDKLQSYLASFSGPANYHHRIKALIDSYCNFMLEEDFPPNIFKEFCHYTTALDKIRNQSFAGSFPSFYDLLRPYWPV